MQSKPEKLKCDVKWSTNGVEMIVHGWAMLFVQGLVVSAMRVALSAPKNVLEGQPKS